MKILLLFLPLLAVVFSFGGGWREDFSQLSQWEARRDWLGNPAEICGIRQTDSFADFFVGEVGKGMKWRRSLYVDVNAFNFLVVRYRLVNCATEKGDYVLWVNDGRHPEGVRFRSEMFQSDGEWHTLVVDLTEYFIGPFLTEMALQVQADERGDAHLYIERIELTDTPPEGVMSPLPEESKEIRIEEGSWISQPTWLGNPARDFGVEKREGILFFVREAGKGMKWAFDLPEPLRGYRWLEVRYRARNIYLLNDYFIYIASAPGGKAPQESFPILLSGLDDDGKWHVKIAPCGIEEVKTIALQLQSRGEGEVEVSRIAFHTRRPVPDLADILPHKKGEFAPPQTSLDISALCNLDRGIIGQRLRFQGWFSSPVISVGSIPFRVSERGGYATTREGKETLSLPLRGNYKEIYLLLGADLPLWEEPGFGGGEMMKIHQVERLKVRLLYGDGDWDEVFPRRLSSGRYEVVRGVDVYSVGARKELREIQILDGMRNASFILFGVTLDTREGPAFKEMKVKTPPVARTKGSLPSLPTTIKVEKGTATISMKEGKVVLDVGKGLGWREIKNNYLFKDMRIEPSPLFILKVNGKEVNSRDFRIDGVEKKGEKVEIRGKYERDVRLRFLLEVQPREGGEFVFTLTLANAGTESVRVEAGFPLLRGIAIASPQDTYYFYPCKGGAISNKDWSFREFYGGAFPLQIMGFFSFGNGGGIYLRTEDLEAFPKWYRLEKKGNEGAMAVEYLVRDLGKEEWRLPSAVIGLHKGDWRQQLQVYIKWKDSWYKPAVERKEWFRRVFNFRQQFLHFHMPKKSIIFDEEEKRFRMEEAIKEDEGLFGGIDYLHIFDWAWTREYGRVGDYDHWEALGGLENFHRAIKEAQAKGIPVGLYIEGYLVDPESNLGKAKGEEWQILNREGKPFPFFAPSFNMCPWVEGWRDYLSKTYKRVKEETGANGYYIDEYGFAFEGRLCWNPRHGHALPSAPVDGELGMVKRIREALGGDVVIYTEESPADITSQYQDGSFTYAISSISDELSPHHLNLYRFVFPDFKTFEIIVCDQPLGSNVQAVKRVLFNGEGIWLEGTQEWFSEEVREYIRNFHRIMKENAECFTSLSPQPLVPTLMEGVYANYFPEKQDGKAVWTIYNTNPFTVEGEVMAVNHLEGSRYFLIWDGERIGQEEVKVRRVGEEDRLLLKIRPGDVVVVRRNL